MKTKEGYVLREVAGSHIVVGTGNIDFNGMITLNESGAALWKALEKGADRAALIKTITDIYEIDDATAAADVDAFLKKLSEADLLTD